MQCQRCVQQHAPNCVLVQRPPGLADGAVQAATQEAARREGLACFTQKTKMQAESMPPRRVSQTGPTGHAARPAAQGGVQRRPGRSSQGCLHGPTCRRRKTPCRCRGRRCLGPGRSQSSARCVGCPGWPAAAAAGAGEERGGQGHSGRAVAARVWWRECGMLRVACGSRRSKGWASGPAAMRGRRRAGKGSARPPGRTCASRTASCWSFWLRFWNAVLLSAYSWPSLTRRASSTVPQVPLPSSWRMAKSERRLLPLSAACCGSCTAVIVRRRRRWCARLRPSVVGAVSYGLGEPLGRLARPGA